MKDSKQIPKGYKPSPLGPIPIDWAFDTWGNMCEKILDGTHFSPKSKEGPFMYITSKNIRNEGLDLTNISYVSENEHKDIYKRCPVKFGDILLTKDGAGTGAVCKNILKQEFSLLSSVAVIRSKSKVLDNDYLFQFIKSPKGQKVIENAISGQAITRITLEKIRSFKIAFPNPINEQTAIANLLNTWDRAINTLTRLITQKQQRKKWLMQQLLTGKKRLKGFKREWKEYHISDLFERVIRRNANGNTNIVTISAQRGFVKQDDFFNKVVASEITENYFLVKRGEFCYNKSYSNGYPWGATKRLRDFDEAVVTTLYICFSIKNSKLSSGDFFESFFEANLLDRGLTKVAHEGGRAHGLLNVTPSDFFSLKIFVPEIEEQKAIASLLSMVSKELKHLMQKEECLKEQKIGLMQLLLTGKKRLK